MKKKSLSLYVVFIVICIGALLAGCSSTPSAGSLSVSRVQKGDIQVKVNADGNIEMPVAVNLYFDATMYGAPYSSRIKEIYVHKGDIVKAGAPLAKLDDTAQRLGVESAQYALELAINNVVQTVCCGVNRAPGFYSDAVALQRYEFALDELQKALYFLAADKFEDATSEISLAIYDLEAAKKIYLDPEYRNLRKEFNEFTHEILENPDFDLAVASLSSEIDSLQSIRQEIGKGDYLGSKSSIETLLISMSTTHTVIKRTTHLPGAYTFPDTCTTFTLINEALLQLSELQKMAAADEIDTVKYSEALRLVMHDLELSDKVLEQNVSTYRQGVNLKTLRDYNIGIQTAIVNLQRSKQALLKTELFAPFDGRITDVNLHAGDMITQRYSVTGVPIDTYVIQLADVKSMRMTGLIDEIDIVKIAGKPLAELNPVVFVDALPGRQFPGKVTFISPFGPSQAGGIQYYGTIQTTVPTYKVEIALDPADAAYLTGGLSATAEIIVDTHRGVLIVPNSAVNEHNGSYIVRVLKDEKTGLIEQRTVGVGVQNQSYTEITSGLSEGEMVVLDKIAVPTRALRK